MLTLFATRTRRGLIAVAVPVVALGMLGGLLVACEPNPCGTSACPPGPPSAVGIFTPLGTGAANGAQIVTEAKALDAHLVRFHQDLGNPNLTVRPEFSTFTNNGLKIVLTVTNDTVPDGTGHSPSHAPVTPDEIATYKARLTSVLDGVAKPTVLMIENEEISANFFSSTMTQYMGELNAAIDVAHARGITVTNGGITNDPLRLMTWQDLKDRGLDADADAYAAKAFATPGDAWILQDLRKVPFTGLSRAPLQTAWDKAKALIPMLAASNVDSVDFHWYTDDDSVLKQSVEYLQRATGKPVVTTEIGQQNTTPSVVTGHLGTLVQALHLPIVVWFDADGVPALGLHDAPGVLRPNGTAFKTYVDAHTDLVT